MLYFLAKLNIFRAIVIYLEMTNEVFLTTSFVITIISHMFLVKDEEIKRLSTLLTASPCNRISTPLRSPIICLFPEKFNVECHVGNTSQRLTADNKVISPKDANRPFSYSMQVSESCGVFTHFTRRID